MREPARTEHEARQRYTRILQRSLLCLTNALWYIGPTLDRHEDNDFSLAFSREPIRLRRQNRDLPRLLFEATQRFRIIPDPRYEGEFKVQTLAYIYAVLLRDGTEFVSWQWHPITTPGRPGPHVHLQIEDDRLGRSLPKLHIPSGRVSFEDVLRFLFEDLDVAPVKAHAEDWSDVLGDSNARFRTFATWS